MAQHSTQLRSSGLANHPPVLPSAAPGNNNIITVGEYLDANCTQPWHFWQADTTQSCLNVALPAVPGTNSTALPSALTNFQCGVEGVLWDITLGSCSNVTNSSAPGTRTSLSVGRCTPTAPRNGVVYYRRLAEYRKPCNYTGECPNTSPPLCPTDDILECGVCLCWTIPPQMSIHPFLPTRSSHAERKHRAHWDLL